MGYEKYYQGGWKSGEAGGTPITPEALNHMEAGIEASGTHADNTSNPHKVTAVQTGALPTSGGTLTGPVSVSGNDNTVTMGTGANDVYLRNTVANKYLQLKNDGTLAYSNNVIYHAENKPTAEDVGAVPTSRTVNGKALSTDVSLADLTGMVGTPKKGAVVYSTINEMGIGLTASCTTEAFASQLQGYSNVQFMHRVDDAIHLTDVPASYGTVEFHKGPNNSYVYGLMVDIYSNVFVYKYHSSQTATNGWKRVSSGSLWTNASPTSTFNGQTITVSGMKFCRSIMVVLQAVNGCHIYHIAHRDISITHANTPTHARYDNGHYTVGRAVGVNFTNNTIQFGHGNQNGTQNQGVAVPIVVIGLC